MYVEEVDDCKN